jgi:penicillin-binding protein 2
MFDSPFSKETSKFTVRRSHTELEPQDVLLDTIAQERKEERFDERKIEVALSSRVSKGLYGCAFLLGVVFLFQVLNLQVVAGDKMRELAQNNTLRVIARTPNRGAIFDQDMVQLVFNRPSFDFLCDKRDMPESREEKEKLLVELSRVFQRPFEELKEEFDKTTSPEILVKEHISHEELVMGETRSRDFQGCYVDETVTREYVEGATFSHVIGYTAKTSSEELQSLQGYSVVDQIGKMGIEKAYESSLRGTPGKTIVERDSAGAAIGEPRRVLGIPGQGIVLWLKSGLQKQIVSSLEEVFADTGARKGAVVALDPKTGGVLAMVSMPSFDNNVFSQGISIKAWEALLKDPTDPLFNRAMSGIGFPTGSVIKPIIALGALQEGIVSEHTVLDTPLELCVDNIYTKIPECFGDWTYHGSADVKKAIAESVNPFFYKIGGGFEGFKGLGPVKIIEYFAKFGLGNRTGIDLPGEGEGILPEIDKNWRLGDTYHLAIGQGPFAITPLQVASAFVAIANRGTLLEPQAVQKFLDKDKSLIEEVQPQVAKSSFADPGNIEIVREGMRQTVTAGSATGFLDHLPVKAAAKTGTAQTGRKTIDGKDYLYSWTVAFAPYDNPEIVLVAVVENIREGQVASLPVVRDALEWYFNKIAD